MLGDVESERDSYVEKLSDYEKVRERLSEMEEREAQLIKNIEDLKTKQTFIQVTIHSCLHFRNSTEKERLCYSFIWGFFLLIGCGVWFQNNVSKCHMGM